MANTATATKPAARKSSSKAKAAVETATATETPTFEVHTALPARAYTLKSRKPAHEDFFNAVREANKGKSGDERVYLVFPASAKGAAAAIKRGSYMTIEAGEFEAKNRTVGGVLQVFVTVADKA